MPADSNTSGEFIGLTYFDEKSVVSVNRFFKDNYSNIKGKPFQQAKKIENGYLTDLLRQLKLEGLQINGVDIEDNWAEINDRISLARFVMGTKSETLERLMATLTKSKLCKQYTFHVEEWRKNYSKIINTIRKTFLDKRIAIMAITISSSKRVNNFFIFPIWL